MVTGAGGAGAAGSDTAVGRDKDVSSAGAAALAGASASGRDSSMAPPRAGISGGASAAVGDVPMTTGAAVDEMPASGSPRGVWTSRGAGIDASGVAGLVTLRVLAGLGAMTAQELKAQVLSQLCTAEVEAGDEDVWKRSMRIAVGNLRYAFLAHDLKYSVACGKVENFQRSGGAN